MDKIFTFEKNSNIRTILINGSVWFASVDICNVLGIKNIRRATKNLEEDEKGVHNMYALGGNQQMVFVSEGGLYTIMLRANGAIKPGTLAYRFRRWVTGVVLPSIRATGSYSVAEKLSTDTLHLDNKSTFANMTAEIRAAWNLRQAAKGIRPC